MRHAYFRSYAAISFLIVAMFWATPSPAARCYVDWTATTGMNTGQSWNDAYVDLQSALTDTNCSEEIWIAKGVYKPVVPQDVGNVASAERAVSFAIGHSVEVYGGFQGNEISLSQRIPAPHLTVLSGDIDQNDVNVDSNQVNESSDDILGSNSYHVVTVAETGNGRVLDAVTITGGKADGPYSGFPTPLDRGGGIYCESAATFTNITVIGNYGEYAGGVYNSLSSPTFVNVSILNNSGAPGPGGMMNDANIPTGGGDSSPLLANATFFGNTSTGGAGAMTNNGSNGTSSTTLLNVTFAANSTTRSDGAGALANIEAPGGTTELTGANVLFWGNLAAGVPSHVVNTGGASTTLAPVVSVDAVVQGVPGNHGGWTPTLLLTYDSPAISAGDPAVCISPPVDGLDQRGAWRFASQNTLCDVGAVEFDDLIFADGFE